MHEEKNFPTDEIYDNQDWIRGAGATDTQVQEKNVEISAETREQFDRKVGEKFSLSRWLRRRSNAAGTKNNVDDSIDELRAEFLQPEQENKGDEVVSVPVKTDRKEVSEGTTQLQIQVQDLMGKYLRAEVQEAGMGNQTIFLSSENLQFGIRLDRRETKLNLQKLNNEASRLEFLLESRELLSIMKQLFFCKLAPESLRQLFPIINGFGIMKPDGNVQVWKVEDFKSGEEGLLEISGQLIDALSVVSQQSSNCKLFTIVEKVRLKDRNSQLGALESDHKFQHFELTGNPQDFLPAMREGLVKTLSLINEVGLRNTDTTDKPMFFNDQGRALHLDIGLLKAVPDSSAAKVLNNFFDQQIAKAVQTAENPGRTERNLKAILSEKMDSLMQPFNGREAFNLLTGLGLSNSVLYLSDHPNIDRDSTYFQTEQEKRNKYEVLRSLFQTIRSKYKFKDLEGNANPGDLINMREFRMDLQPFIDEMQRLITSQNTV